MVASGRAGGVRTRGSLGRTEKMEEWVGGNGLEEVDGHVLDGMMAMDVEELAAKAVKAMEGYFIGVDAGPAGTQE